MTIFYAHRSRVPVATIALTLLTACAANGPMLEPANRPGDTVAVSRVAPGQSGFPVKVSIVKGTAATVKPLPSDLLASDPVATALAKEVIPRVEAIRGLKFLRPVRIGVLNRAALAAQLEREFAEEVNPEDLRAQGLAFELLGLVPTGLDLMRAQKSLLLSEIAGFYDAKRQQLYLMREEMSGDAAKFVMVHELCHALEDQHFDFKSMDEQLRQLARFNDDRGFAYIAATEGSAVVVMNEWLVDSVEADTGVAFESADLDGDDSMDPSEADLDGDDSVPAADLDGPARVPVFSELDADAPPPAILWIPLQESYMAGEEFLRHGSGGVPGAKDWAKVLTDPPRSSEQILHPEKYWDPASRDEPREIAIPDLTGELGLGWRKIGENVLGEIGVMVLTGGPFPSDPMELDLEMVDESDRDADRNGDDAVQTMEIDMRRTPEDPSEFDEAVDDGNLPRSTPEAAGWDGDLYTVFEGPAHGARAGSVVVVWVSVWDSADDAFEMLQFLESSDTPPARARRAGDRLAAVFSRGLDNDTILSLLVDRALVESQLRAPAPLRAKSGL